MRCYVYAHKRLDNNKIFYIGRGTVSSKASGKCHKNLYSRAHVDHVANKYWMNIKNSVGFSVEILQDYLSWEVSMDLEKFYIKKYGRIDLNEGSLVNLTDGGEGSRGAVASEKLREVLRIRMSGEGNPQKKQENKDKLSKRMKEDNPMHNKESVDKAVKSYKEGLYSGKFIHGRLGKSREDLTKRNLEDNPAKKPEVREKLRQAALARTSLGIKNGMSKTVVDTETGVEYPSIRACAKGIGVSNPTAHSYIKKGRIVYKQ